MASEQIRQGLILMIGLIVSVGMHEFGHAIVAHKLGDPTPDSQGRVTVNPIAHMDPFGTLLIPALLIFSGAGMLFGWGRPVQISPRHFKRSISMSLGDTLVSLAGPAMNIVLALFFTAALAVVFYFTKPNPGKGIVQLHWALRRYIQLNLVLCIFNLLPIPPLDGSHLLFNHLSSKYNHIKDFLSNYGFYILIAMMIIPGVLTFIFKPVLIISRVLIQLAYTLGG
ncbi:MAG: site-2 protease family protein [Myxococcota bacterium]